MSIAKKPNQRLVPFFRRLGPEFSSFVGRGTFLIHKPAEYLLGGFQFDPTSAGTHLRWMRHFVAPLYIPDDDVTLSFGSRFPLTGGYRNTETPVAVEDSNEIVIATIETVEETLQIMREEGLPIVLPRLTLSGFYSSLTKWEYKYAGSHAYEALTYTALLLGRADDALQHLRDSFMYATLQWGSSDPNTEGLASWRQRQLSRWHLMRNLLEAKEVDKAKAQLEEWRQYTIQAFKVEDLVVN